MYPFYLTREAVLHLVQTRDDFEKIVYLALRYTSFELSDEFISELDSDRLIQLAGVLNSDLVNKELLRRIGDLS